MTDLPETILQFGSGRFLRGFADLFVHHGNLVGQNIGRVVVVQSTGDGRAGGLNAQGGRYHVAVRGYEAGAVVNRVEECGSVSRALHAGTQWREVLEFARSPALHTILSNTTEAGYAGDGDDGSGTPPASFPGKLAAVLHARWRAGLPGVSVVPCELIERNAAVLRAKVLDLARRLGHGPDFETWVVEECAWQQTLVDRIVTGPPAGHPLLSADPMMVVAEPFAFWALEDHQRSRFRLDHPAVIRTADVTPYFLRKVRILNAAHTALLIRAVPRGFGLVRDAVNDPELAAWLGRLLGEEIVPTLDGRVDDAVGFAASTVERFKNPFLDHKFSDIALQHESKVQVRLMPTAAEYEAQFGRPPPLLTELLGCSAP